MYEYCILLCILLFYVWQAMALSRVTRLVRGLCESGLPAAFRVRGTMRARLWEMTPRQGFSGERRPFSSVKRPRGGGGRAQRTAGGCWVLLVAAVIPNSVFSTGCPQPPSALPLM